MKRLIVTGDDFGLALPVNEAIEIAHREGILSAASLMVGAGAAADALERAGRLPTLRVGLHLVLVEGRPLLPPERVPDLVDESGEFHEHLVAAGFRFFFLPRVRRQLAAEIRAQFEAFRATGLALDHVNTHHHMHLHPTVLGLILKIGRCFGLGAVRLPREPALTSWQASNRRLAGKAGGALALAPWMALLRARLRRADIRSNDRIFGRGDSGTMDEATVLQLLAALPDGVTEMYFHVATRRCPELERAMVDDGPERELAALTSPRVREALEGLGVRPIGFGDL